MVRALCRTAVFAAVFAAIIVILPAASSPKAGSSSFSFALIGDVPYGAGDDVKLDRIISQVNDDHKLAWVLHVGDIKNGSSDASNALIQSRFSQYQHFNPAFIYTPGDNEWTDVHRTGRYPLERLAYVRSVFFPTPGMSTGGDPMAVRTQAADAGFGDFVENQLWVKSQVVFSAIHVVGSHNDLDPWTGYDATDSTSSPRADRINEYTKRLQANLAWIDQTFATAAAQDAKGVFIMMQADPAFELARTSSDRNGYNEIIDALTAKTVEFGKPVVVAHGDSHFFRYDKPLTAPAADHVSHRVENFSRVETFGSEDVHWVRVTVDPKSETVFFFEPVVIAANRFAR